MEKLCSEHSGIKEAIETLKKNEDDQWKEINVLKNRFLVLITGVALTLLGVIANLALALIK